MKFFRELPNGPIAFAGHLRVIGFVKRAGFETRSVFNVIDAVFKGFLKEALIVLFFG